jgi:ATP-dependent HslUV protease ATP-binding subunit HslU
MTLAFSVTNFSPRDIVAQLDRFVIGQEKAKRACAIAVINRRRRKQVPVGMREEISPHNILMVGDTGVGKTEMGRRLAKIVQAPFIKVEATKFTEIGYVGRDVDSIIRDLLDIGINLTREKMRQEVINKAQEAAEKKLINAIVGEGASDETKARFYEKYKNHEIDDREVEITVTASSPSPNMPTFDIPGMPGGQMGVFNLGDIISKSIGGTKTKKVKLAIKDAYQILLKEESEKLIDEEKVTKAAIDLVEQEGIVFLDEIDKIASRNNSRAEVNREGVQRDLLPLLEGTTVNTKYGNVRTDHILFIASGAFHLARPSDLLPELQGRLPIRVELSALTEADLIRILQEPEYSILKQYIALFAVENLKINFTEDGVAKIAQIATEINREVENIGARRLHTVLEKLLEDLNFSAQDMAGQEVNIDANYVTEKLSDLGLHSDLKQFIL